MNNSAGKKCSVNFFMPADMNRVLKAQAALEGRPMTELICEFISMGLATKSGEQATESLQKFVGSW